MTLVMATAVSACGATSTRPHGASISEHERAARINEAAATEYEIQADTAIGGEQGEYQRLWSLARSAERHAEAHRLAAATLRGSEDPAACVDVPYEVTASCPLAAHPVLAYEETDDGVRVVYGGADAAVLGQHVRCHVAHAEMAADQHPEAGSCPLVGDVDVEVDEHPDGAVLVISAESSAEAERLRGIYEAGDDHADHGHK